ncbi:nucleoside hydrolase [Myxococcus sp. CA040A]|uniref:Nucleoside hydrolase n=2 Tax=Myxococcaceae TaxID=31 RepID=A0A540X479_9BACT|nr:nucleoside hydrolase [Myxococcus sp. CA040A]TQF16040.1 nucleoside hydrolase [Myxococcus llanfairpwllgwyngyllgogerychwyrndrobwllllantysiliogogogochensis]
MAQDILFDMETSDPDDALTLCLLATHPAVALRAVTVTPGTLAQVGMVRHLLARAGRSDVPVGARNPAAEKESLSAFHTQWLGPLPPSAPDALAHEVLALVLGRFPEATLLTGAPLQNLRLLLELHPDIKLHRWVAQGGFAGDNVVPPEHRLPKFEGRRTCPTFNFNGDPKGALLALSSDRMGRRELVSKNVTHGLAYDGPFHERMRPYASTTPGLGLIFEAMERYLAQRPEGKLLHDPIAACAAIDPEIITWAEVEMVRQRGEWGAELAQGTHTFISVALDSERFFQTLVGIGAATKNNRGACQG